MSTGWGPGAGTSDFALNVSLGNIPGTTNFILTGRSAGLGTAGTTFKDIWDGNPSIGNWVPPTTARIHDIVSDSANDTLLGTGARKIRVRGILASGNLATEIVELNGLTPVATVNAYQSVNSLLVTEWDLASAPIENDGEIRATAQTDSTVTSLIPAGKNRTLQGCFLIGANMKLLIYSAIFSIDKTGGGGTDGDFRVAFFEPNKGIFTTIPVSVTGSGTSALNFTFNFPIKFEQSTFVKIQAAPTQNNTSANGIIAGLLTDG